MPQDHAKSKHWCFVMILFCINCLWTGIVNLVHVHDWLANFYFSFNILHKLPNHFLVKLFGIRKDNQWFVFKVKIAHFEVTKCAIWFGRTFIVLPVLRYHILQALVVSSPCYCTSNERPCLETLYFWAYYSWDGLSRLGPL